MTSTACAAIQRSNWPADGRRTAATTCARSRRSLWENALDLKSSIRLTYALVDAWCDSYVNEPEAVTLDIDDTLDVVHGAQHVTVPCPP